MKVVILCGGQGTRIRDVSEVVPKPMLPIGDKPILWHIMKIYADQGFKEFILCLGYKGWIIKEFFLNYYAKISDISLTLGEEDSITYHSKNNEADWKVTMVDTGEETLTGKRILTIKNYLKGEDCFSVTYGDGVADINIKKVMDTHKGHGLAATITGVQPLGRFGEIETNGKTIQSFNEKPNVASGIINGGFMIFNTSVLDQYFDAKANESLESDIIPKIVKNNQAGVYKHEGSWQCVDTAREYKLLNQLWNDHQAFWKLS